METRRRHRHHHQKKTGVRIQDEWIVMNVTSASVPSALYFFVPISYFMLHTPHSSQTQHSHSFIHGCFFSISFFIDKSQFFFTLLSITCREKGVKEYSLVIFFGLFVLCLYHLHRYHQKHKGKYLLWRQVLRSWFWYVVLQKPSPAVQPNQTTYQSQSRDLYHAFVRKNIRCMEISFSIMFNCMNKW